MSRVAFPCLLALLTTSPLFALTGIVRNEAGRPLARAVVTLQSDTAVRHITDSTGAFTLTPTGLVFTPHAVAHGMVGLNVNRLSLRNGVLGFHLQSPVAQGSFNLFSGDGKTRFKTRAGPMSAGAHRFEIPPLAPGAYAVRFLLDGKASVWRATSTGESGGPASQGPVISPTPLARGAAQAPVASVAAIAAIDTVLVTRAGYLPTKTPVTSYTQTELVIVPPADTVAGLPAVADYSVDGPHATVVEANVGPGNAYTIIRPQTLGTNGFRHAPIIYGHGINGQVSGFTGFLRAVASHGFVIIARNVLTGGPNNAGNTAAMLDGLNWILAQDTTAGSVFFGKLATDRAAAMGYSVGGTAAVDIGGHAALRTVVSIHGHISTAALKGTLLQTSGTRDNIGLPMQQETFENSVTQTFLATVTNADHGYIQNGNGGVQRAAIIAWLRFWIYQDQAAKRYFYGSDCVMCTPPWENPQRKNWD